MSGPLRIAPLSVDDMDAVERVLLASFNWAMPDIPKLHTPDENRSFLRQQLFPRATMVGAWRDNELIGYIAFKPGWVEHLYVLSNHAGSGVGSALLAAAKQVNTELDLWTFRRNMRARRFYEERGFVAVEETDGTGNEEREPDVRYRWQLTPAA